MGDYMWVWIHTEDLLNIAFIFPLHPDSNNNLITFQLSFSIGYVNSALYLRRTRRIMADLANHIWAATVATSPHPMSAIMDTTKSADSDAHAGIILSTFYTTFSALVAKLLPMDHAALLLYVDIYIRNFIVFVQGVTDERSRSRNHMFNCTNRIFQPNSPGDSICQEPNYLKNLREDDAAWTTHNCVIGWIMDTLTLNISLLT